MSESPLSSAVDRARSLLGKHVRVTMDSKDGEDKVIAEGILLRSGNYGEFVIQNAEDPLDIQFCWPMLDIEEVTEKADCGSTFRHKAHSYPPMYDPEKPVFRGQITGRAYCPGK